MNEKLDILRSIQVGVGATHRSSDSTPKHTLASSSDSPKEIVESAIEQSKCVVHVRVHVYVHVHATL